ncbi:TrmH family RNA methyltransferase [candidate division CSSED10-310 bacterium]|uniref:TrmH family RNA methyltransferase n=1 Tax=candidate division CSSED10-310 bacterium TaxID=2855610 RepID=A0ABV6YZH8_UNCC1
MEEYLFFHTRFSAAPAFIFEREQKFTYLSWQPKYSFEIVVDQIRTPFNVGSILRLIDNFGLKRLVHSTSWLQLNHPQLRKAARGCEHWIPVVYESDLPAYLAQTTLPIIGLENDEETVSINDWEVPAACVLVLGNDSYGITSAIRLHCDQTVSIPMSGFKRSMNVHHALAIVCQKIVASCPKSSD